MKRANQITGNIGMYYVCYRLSMLGLNVMPTARNAKGIDIVAYDEGGKFVGIQVKTLSQPSAIPLGKNCEGLMGDYWCVVVGQKDGSWKVFVMTPDEIKKRSHKATKGDSYWVEYKEFGKDKTLEENWDRIVNDLNKPHK